MTWMSSAVRAPAVVPRRSRAERERRHGSAPGESRSVKRELPGGRVMERTAVLTPALIWFAAVFCVGPVRAASRPDSAPVTPPAYREPADRESAPLIQRRDALFAIVAISAVAIT